MIVSKTPFSTVPYVEKNTTKMTKTKSAASSGRSTPIRRGAGQALVVAEPALSSVLTNADTRQYQDKDGAIAEVDEEEEISECLKPTVDMSVVTVQNHPLQSSIRM